MDWVDPWVGLGRVGSRFFSVFGGSVLVGKSRLTKIFKKDYVNAIKARLDKVWLHQADKFDVKAWLTKSTR